MRLLSTFPLVETRTLDDYWKGDRIFVLDSYFEVPSRTLDDYVPGKGFCIGFLCMKTKQSSVSFNPMK